MTSKTEVNSVLTNIDISPYVRQCPVCECKESQPFRFVDMVVPTTLSLQCQYMINQCDNCGAVFHNVDPGLDRSNYYGAYTGSDTNSYVVTSEQLYLNDLTINFLEHAYLSSKDLVIADIGCSFGLTLTELKRRGYRNLYAIDPDKSAVKYLSESGIEGVVGDAETERRELESKFDLIILRHVLEHLYEPRKALNNVKKWLKPGGKVYIELPALSLYQETGPFPGYFFEFEHINHFSLNALLNMMDSYSLTNYEATKDIYPCMRALFDVSEKKKEVSFSADSIFVESSFSELNPQSKKVIEKIEELNDGRKIALWGVSIFVYRLLTHTALRDINIQRLVDGNSSLQGAKILGLEIQKPDVLRDFDGDILICGENSAESIKRSVSSMNIKNNVICLMGD